MTDLTKISDYIYNNPTKGIIFLLIVLAVFIMNNKYLQLFFLKRLKMITRRKNNLLIHDIFINEQEYHRKVAKYRFSNEYNDDIFKKLLDNKITCVIKGLNLFVRDKSNYKKDKHILYEDIIKLITKMIKDYETAFLNELIVDYKGAAYFLFTYVNEAFTEYHKPNINILHEKLKYIKSDDVFLSNNYERIAFALRLIQDALRDGIFDAAKTFEPFNGEVIKMIKEFKYASVKPV